ncbi:hypothetical protein [Mucisphaera calidilacus]|uniref:Uncharacterized protein n=1 Tax=Mucisphaera calidilacus TaxID=2527982 RepID=A0A518BTT3_9BACT|nr:hypothetical protein [Mucisphaera calidilacus]QDU70390.1 hypothetical protein Pan265_02170 [Mucisphaera calidilacus]
MNIIQQGLASSTLQTAQQATETARERDKRARDARKPGQAFDDQLDISTRIQDDAVEMDAPANSVREQEAAAATKPEVLDTAAQPNPDHPHVDDKVEAIEHEAADNPRPNYKHLDLEA